MEKLKLTKASLQQQRAQLGLYRRLLPTLEMKRHQLMAEHRRERAELERLLAAVASLETEVGAELPMLAAAEAALGGLVRLREAQVGAEHAAGVKVPRLEGVSFDAADYSPLALPPWADRLVVRIREAAELRLRAGISAERAMVLGAAVRRISRRVNLFEQVLIPRAQRNILRIQIHLGDLERDAVIRAKLSKARRATAGEAA